MHDLCWVKKWKSIAPGNLDPGFLVGFHILYCNNAIILRNSRAPSHSHIQATIVEHYRATKSHDFKNLNYHYVLRACAQIVYNIYRNNILCRSSWFTTSARQPGRGVVYYVYNIMAKNIENAFKIIWEPIQIYPLWQSRNQLGPFGTNSDPLYCTRNKRPGEPDGYNNIIK